MSKYLLRDGTVLGDREEGLTYEEAHKIASDFSDPLIASSVSGIFECKCEQGFSILDALAFALECAVGIR